MQCTTPARLDAAALSLAMLTVLAAGCGEANPVAVDSWDLAPASDLHLGQPFHLSAGAMLQGIQLAPDFGPPSFGKSDFQGRCSVPSDFVVEFVLEGQATHLGSFTGMAEHCSQVDFNSGSTRVITDGEMVLTSANGDELWTRYARDGVGEGVPEDHTFVGGTGRFTSAEGEALGRPDCNQEAGTCTFVMYGVIRYRAADRER